MRKWLRRMVLASAEVWSRNCCNFCNQQNLNGDQVDISFVSIQIDALNELSVFDDCLVMNLPYFALVTASALMADRSHRRLIDFLFILTTNLRFVPSLVTPGERTRSRPKEGEKKENLTASARVYQSRPVNNFSQPSRFAGRHRNVCQIYQPARLFLHTARMFSVSHNHRAHCVCFLFIPARVSGSAPQKITFYIKSRWKGRFRNERHIMAQKELLTHWSECLEPPQSDTDMKGFRDGRFGRRSDNPRGEMHDVNSKFPQKNKRTHHQRRRMYKLAEKENSASWTRNLTYSCLASCRVPITFSAKSFNAGC